MGSVGGGARCQCSVCAVCSSVETELVKVGRLQAREVVGGRVRSWKGKARTEGEVAPEGSS